MTDIEDMTAIKDGPIISQMTEADWPEVAAIYREGIDTGNATLAANPPASWADWQRGKINACSLAARNRGAPSSVLGWAALSPYSSRPCYAGVAEVSLYVAAAARGQGIGSALMQALIEVSEQNGIWTLQAGIFPENPASLSLHQKHGFRVVGLRIKIGRMESGPRAGEWRDVILLERRSAVAGQQYSVAGGTA
jgi:phosphinothricin acetyltransferase